MSIPSATLNWWAAQGLVPATSDELARVKAAIGPDGSADYIDFLARHGFATWDMDIPDTFEYQLAQSGGTLVKRASITHLWRCDHIERMAADVREAGDGLPLYYPNTHFPIGCAGGQTQVLLELSGTPGRIWFWPERADEWGTGDNITLGFVANSFAEFVDALMLEV